MALAIALVIAVVGLTGCDPASTARPSSAAKPAATSQAKPGPKVNGDISTVNPKGYDQLKRSSSGTPSQDFTPGEIRRLGLSALYATTGQLAEGGAIAIAELGKYCVVTMAGRDASTVAVGVMSRYNTTALNTAQYGGLTFIQAKAWLDALRPVCDGTQTSLPPSPGSAMTA